VSSADRLDIETESIDCVVIDPPYYDNVQYGELLDFYYVWLRNVLNDDYPEFASTHVPKLREVSVNRERGKDETYYLQALRNSFEEVHRILSFGGDLVCLFHIAEDEAWRNLIRILVRTGFQIRGAIQLQELDHETEDSRQAYDIVVFAQKSPRDEDISFEMIRQNLLYEIQDMAEEEREYYPNISEHELRTILRARGLSEYSAHYPNVYNKNGDADVDTGIDMVDEVLQKSL
jgi:adenine-specific DNA methylase